MDMFAIPEEDGGGGGWGRSRSLSQRRRGANTAASTTIPLLVIVVCCVISVSHSPHYWKALSSPQRRARRVDHRALLTLRPEHVDQYPFDNFLEVGDPTPPLQNKVVGFYWQVPRCGGTTLKHILGTCLRRVQAARTSADYCDMKADTLQICQTNDKVGSFVNADPSDHGGIQRCDRMGLVPSGVADVLVSSRILHAATLYSPNHKGRLFTILRNPIERAVSTFYYLQNAHWERHYRPELKEMTLLDYAALPDTANNWMTRWLTGKNAEPHMTREDLEFAKELLRRKFLVLLTDEMSSSIKRLMHHMEWEIPPEHYNATQRCLASTMKKEQGQNRNKHYMPTKGSPEYEALRAINDLDLELYEYAKELFVQQWSVVFKGGTKSTIDGLFRFDNLPTTTTTTTQDDLAKASQSSEHAASMAAASLMERPPEEASLQSAEAKSNLAQLVGIGTAYKKKDAPVNSQTAAVTKQQTGPQPQTLQPRANENLSTMAATTTTTTTTGRTTATSDPTGTMPTSQAMVPKSMTGFNGAASSAAASTTTLTNNVRQQLLPKSSSSLANTLPNQQQQQQQQSSLSLQQLQSQQQQSQQLERKLPQSLADTQRPQQLSQVSSNAAAMQQPLKQ